MLTTVFISDDAYSYEESSKEQIYKVLAIYIQYVACCACYDEAACKDRCMEVAVCASTEGCCDLFDGTR